MPCSVRSRFKELSKDNSGVLPPWMLADLVKAIVPDDDDADFVQQYLYLYGQGASFDYGALRHALKNFGSDRVVQKLGVAV